MSTAFRVEVQCLATRFLGVTAEYPELAIVEAREGAGPGSNY